MGILRAKKNPERKQKEDMKKIQENQMVLFAKLNCLLDKILSEEEKKEMEKAQKLNA